MKYSLATLFIYLALLASGTTVHADEALNALALQQQWDHANFDIADKKEKARALESLSAKARVSAAQYNTDPEVQIWTGIILSTYAGEAGLSALGLVKEAKTYFEKAIAINPESLKGSAYTSLGSLYYQVPGWPIGFGDDDKAAEMLQKGLELDPEGIDSNYFYADFLRTQKEYAKAATHYEKVLAAPPREGRDSADKGRKLQAQEALDAVRKKIQ